MWIKERKEITNYNEILEFIKECNEFHDMRIGGFDYDSDKKNAKIFIEELDYNKKIPDDDVLSQYYFEINDIEKFIFHSDIALKSYVLETYESNKNEITIALTNGEIVFKASKILLSVPINVVINN